MYFAALVHKSLWYLYVTVKKASINSLLFLLKIKTWKVEETQPQTTCMDRQKSCVVGLALCAEVRRKKEQEASDGRSHGSTPFRLCIYSLNEDTEGMSGKSANDKVGGHQGSQRSWWDKQSSRTSGMNEGWDTQSDNFKQSLTQTEVEKV